MKRRTGHQQCTSKLGLPAHHSPPIMPQGKAVSEEVQWVVVRMAATMSVEDISMYTQISPRKVRGIMYYFNAHGTVRTPARSRTKLHRSLSDDHINVRFCWLEMLIVY
jgi:hypothetical protein